MENGGNPKFKTIAGNVPELRFAGFCGGWQEVRLGDISKLITKGTTPKHKSGMRNVNFVKIESISDSKIKPTEKITTAEHEGYLHRSKLEENDILFSIAGTLGRAAVVKKSILPANTNQALAIIRGFDCDIYFLFAILSGHTIKNFIRRNLAVGAQPNLSLGQVRGLKIYIAQKPEQKRIGEFFCSLDASINLLHKKIDALQKLKKGYLQKLFPQLGEAVPSLRFAGFSGPWEKRRLSDYAEETYGGGTPRTNMKHYWGGPLPWIQTSDIIEHKVFGAQIKKKLTQTGLQNSAAKLIPANSIAITTRVAVGKLALIPFEYATSQDFLSLSRLKADKFFAIYSLYHMLQSEKNSVQGTSIKGLTKNGLLNKIIAVPSQIAEQEAIGKFFLLMDKEIDILSEKLIQLKKLKPAYLKKMLV
ncbi:MAG: restriction endonuclease subunit S [Clostridiales bacterium]|nr:restriction endonuclease subunit S [Clostridiales bacterium]